jgi:hypothetical protein
MPTSKTKILESYEVPVVAQSGIQVDETSDHYIIHLEKEACVHPQEVAPLLALLDMVPRERLFSTIADMATVYVASAPRQQLTPARWLMLYRLQQWAEHYVLEPAGYETAHT